MDRRTFVKLGLVASAAPVLAAGFLEEPYLRACFLARVPAHEIGTVVVCEVCVPTFDGPDWEPKRFDELKTGMVFRVLTSKGYERNEQGEIAEWIAVTDAVETYGPERGILRAERHERS